MHMQGTQQKAGKKKLMIALLALCCLGGLLTWFLLNRSYALQRKDFQRISAETYDTVFLSMYPTDTYDVSDFEYFRAMTVLKTDYILSDFSDLKKYMRRIASSGNTISTVYLGIRPDKVTAAELSALIASYPSASFELILSYPSVDYWQQLSDAEYEKVLTSYCNFLSATDVLSTAHVFFFEAEEWLITNPSLYTTQWDLTADAARFVLTNSDTLHGFQVTADNAADRIGSLRSLTAALRTAPPVYPDLSDTAIVFFGDSVIGNYTDGTSIPEVIAGLTGATVYNCGYGGNPAAMKEDVLISLPGIAAAFTAQDLSVLPQDAQVYQGVTAYISDPPRTSGTCFVISYGLNDYFNDQPIASEDPYDITTYCGAIRTAVKTLSAYDADAQILLCTPTYTAYSIADKENAAGKNHRLQDYVDAVFCLSEELNVGLVDNYYTLGINESNSGSYLADKVHPTEAGRFLIAKQIIHAICK